MGNQMSDALESETISHTIMKRKAKPAEIANGILFFASDLSEYVTGQILRVDGGMLL
jgi:NAD(P)-dependent dehydrogenase (short-subunit alcohol dehydrogenase family)